MGQYFKLVNADKQEVVDLPSGIKLPEIMSSPMSGQVLLYLMFDGPFDGTTLLDRIYSEGDEKVEEGIIEKIEQEERLEQERENDQQAKLRMLKRAIKYTDDHPFEPEDADLSSLHKFPENVIEKYREKYNRRVNSTYRNTDESWQTQSLKRVVCAGFYTGEDALCGRWSGDDVRIVGDYADNDLYSAMYGTVVVKLDNGTLAEWNGPHPCAEEPIERDGPGVSARMYDRDAQPGDLVRANRLDCGQHHVEFVEYKENEWDDITASVYHEMARYMPDLFGELADKVGEPDIVFGSGRNER